MGDTTKPSGAYASLKRDSVGFLGAVGLPLGFQAPTAGVAVLPAVMAGYVGPSGPLAFAIGVLVGLIVAYSISLFARRFASAGSFYAFNGIALGPANGFASIWMLLMQYLAGTAGVAIEMAIFFIALWKPLGNVHWMIFGLVTLAIAVILSIRSIEFSAVTSAVVESLGIIFILILGIIVIAHGGYNGHAITSSWQSFTLNGTTIGAMALGVVFSFTGFSGFEIGATLGEEARNPRVAIPRSILLCLLIAGAAYIFGDYIAALGFPSTKALAASPAPMIYVADHYMSNTAGEIFNVLVLLSGFGALLGGVNASSRLLFTLGRDGFGTRRIASVHPKFNTPVIAISLATAVMVIAMVVVVKSTAVSALGKLFTLGIICLFVAYLVTVIGAAVYFTRQRLSRLKLLVPYIGIPVMAYIIYKTVLPVPAYPTNIVEILAGVWIVAGYALILADKRLRARVSASPLFEKKELALDRPEPAHRAEHG